MYIQKISIKINDNVDKTEIEDDLSLLTSFYRSNGQIQGDLFPDYFNQNMLICIVYTHEKNSLNKINNNFYVNKQINKIENKYNIKLKYQTLGISGDYENSSCNCNKSKFYILFTNYLSIESPITCGTCLKSVPLYKLPVFYDYGYQPILSWNTNYKACDKLQMNCEVGERFGLNQMQNHDSQLSKQGFEICKGIEELTKIPTYYYLHNYRKVKKGQLFLNCPKCNKEWSSQENNKFYDFKCDNCRIVSVISPNT